MKRDRERKLLRGLVRTMRVERDLTQAELGCRVGVRQAVVSEYETGRRQLEFVEVQAICAALGVSLATFIRRLESSAVGDLG